MEIENGPQTVTVDLNAPPAAVPPVAPTPAAFSGAPGDFQKDMAVLAAESVSSAPAPEVQEQPTATESATAPVTVPEKFKDAEGNLDQAKLDKSQKEADAKIAALNKYLSDEKEMRRKMNEANGLKNVPIAPVTQAPAPTNPFAVQLEADMAKYGAGEVLARLFEAAKETAKKEVLSDVQADREERLESKSRRELDEIAKYDQEVLTPEGLESLARIRAERPWLEKSGNPTSEAYDIYLAERVKKQRQMGQVMPTPKGMTAKAPPTPVSPAPRAVVQPKGPDLSSKEAIDAHLNSLDEAGREKFFRSRGLRY